MLTIPSTGVAILAGFAALVNVPHLILAETVNADLSLRVPALLCSSTAVVGNSQRTRNRPIRRRGRAIVDHTQLAGAP